jgi:hypothetical protein
MLAKSETYRIGSRIRITRGQLTGLTGVIAKMSGDNSNCVLTIDGWETGVYLSMRCDMLSSDIEELAQS